MALFPYAPLHTLGCDLQPGYSQFNGPSELSGLDYHQFHLGIPDLCLIFAIDYTSYYRYLEQEQGYCGARDHCVGD